ncbi:MULTISPECIES: alpha/beta fold hydrolase BchO [unclassified Novosphingobium]|uniref:alpha/beta fold hydrolase BchO n=1 Tax=unclassified Novosphingobium TaxID=2644732 RepID=UPI00146CE590|nr:MULTISPECIES: alpha/beta fold hydrolase BchO [unclassified Novosphingobium]NMN05056.1 magnesium chelatase accessory protein [Novosphingobium sp. SG919]NMN87351.1 magnesium chelatase accessory protein [Novosphingobium sp. SG916]
MSGAPRWDGEGRCWPHRAASRFVATPGLVWHVQVMGAGPVVLLIHGTGAATHSWRGVMPVLARDFTVVAPDLPGHGFTRGRPAGGLTLPAMARALADLLRALDLAAALVAGHSAGAAIALQWAQDAGGALPVIGFNPALMPFPGLAAQLFPSLARMLFVNPLVPRLLAGIARLPGEPERFLTRATGSTIDAGGLAAYRALLGCPAHCAGAMEMMASWDLDALRRRLPAMAMPVHLVHARADVAVPLHTVEAAAALLPHARLTVLPHLGHLAHEERPDLAAQTIAAQLQESVA